MRLGWLFALDGCLVCELSGVVNRIEMVEDAL